MTLLLFGRDSTLSKHELIRYARANNISLDIQSSGDKFIILGDDFDSSLIKDLAGTIRIANVLQVIELNSEVDYSSLSEIIDIPIAKSFNYALTSINVDKSVRAEITSKLKQLFKKYKIKAVLKQPQVRQGNYIVDPGQFQSWDLSKGVEIIVINEGSRTLIAQSITASDPKEFKDLDENRPERVLTHGTSFRLAKIMVNMLGLKYGSTILDPFCGTGTFLMIGLSTGYNVIGVDNDNALVSVAKNNLQWMSKKLETKLSWEVIKGNAEDFKSKPDGVVFEPYMGPFLKDLPKFMEAMNIRKELDTLYTKTFKNLSNNLDSKTPVVCILPDIPTRDGKLLETPKEVFSKNQFTLHNEESIQLPNPVKYNTPGGSIVQRRIYLLVKS